MRELLWLSSGAIVWAAHFAVLYGVTAVACARGLPHAVPWCVAVAGGAAAALLLLIMRSTTGTFLGWTTAAIAGTALFAVVLESAAGLLVSPCT
jgi:hypothetical protein